jgi:hypothetical protein
LMGKIEPPHSVHRPDETEPVGRAS